jgi:hypothetical protein
VRAKSAAAGGGRSVPPNRSVRFFGISEFSVARKHAPIGLWQVLEPSARFLDRSVRTRLCTELTELGRSTASFGWAGLGWLVSVLLLTNWAGLACICSAAS